jgi:hypothetical protein
MHLQRKHFKLETKGTSTEKNKEGGSIISNSSISSSRSSSGWQKATG